MSKNKGIFENINNLIGKKQESSNDVVEKKDVPSKEKISPGQKLMKNYEKTPANLLSKGLSKTFGSAKDTAFGAVDSLSGNDADAAQGSTTEESKVSPNPSISKEREVEASIYNKDLISDNPLKRLKAKVEVAAEERRREIRIARNKRVEQVNSVKEKIFEARDSVQRTYETVLNIPSEIEKGVRETQQSVKEIEEQARNTIEEVQKTPQKVQQAVDDTKKKVEDTQRATMEVVNEVKAIPDKVEKTVSDTKRKIEDTKKGTEEFFSKVEKFVKSFESKNESKPFVAADSPTTIAEIDPGLEIEVNEALNVAKEALKETQTTSQSKGRKGSGT